MSNWINPDEKELILRTAFRDIKNTPEIYNFRKLMFISGGDLCFILTKINVENIVVQHMREIIALSNENLIFISAEEYPYIFHFILL